MADAGAREFTLLGQNVNAYHGLDERGREATLADLLARAARLPGVLRLRYTTSHPNDMDEELIRAHAENDKLAPFLHLPVQSGSDRILDSDEPPAHRPRLPRHRCAVRRARPDIAFSSDFIVGFPGETDADFEATLALVREVGFASSYAFKYSPRPGHAGGRLEGAGRRKRSRRSGWRACSNCSKRSARPSTAPQSAAASTSCSTSRAGTKASSSAGRPICRRSTPIVPASRIGEMTEVEIVGVKPNSLVAEVVAYAS